MRRSRWPASRGRRSARRGAAFGARLGARLTTRRRACLTSLGRRSRTMGGALSSVPIGPIRRLARAGHTAPPRAGTPRRSLGSSRTWRGVHRPPRPGRTPSPRLDSLPPPGSRNVRASRPSPAGDRSARRGAGAAPRAGGGPCGTRGTACRPGPGQRCAVVERLARESRSPAGAAVQDVPGRGPGRPIRRARAANGAAARSRRAPGRATDGGRRSTGRPVRAVRRRGAGSPTSCRPTRPPGRPARRRRSPRPAASSSRAAPTRRSRPAPPSRPRPDPTSRCGIQYQPREGCRPQRP